MGARHPAVRDPDEGISGERFGAVPLSIQGTGDETRSFVYIDDFTDGLMLVMENGAHMNIYHIGTMEEVTIRNLAGLVGEYFGQQIEVVTGQILSGGPQRRCPDTAKIAGMGYKPRHSLRRRIGNDLPLVRPERRSGTSATDSHGKEDSTMPSQITLAAGTGSSIVVDACQICQSPNLETVLFLGYLPPVNQMRTIGSAPQEQPAYPAAWLVCPRCQLVQLGLIVDKQILFPPDYPYTSGTTKILRDNFAELYAECRQIVSLGPDDLIIDVGSNDGTLLSNFPQWWAPGTGNRAQRCG